MGWCIKRLKKNRKKKSKRNRLPYRSEKDGWMKKASSKKRVKRVINSKKSSMERTDRVDHHVQTSFEEKKNGI